MMVAVLELVAALELVAVFENGARIWICGCIDNGGCVENMWLY